MKLYILRARETVGYDSYDSFVVRAPNEKEARRIASEQGGDQGPETWLSPDLSTCEPLLHLGPAEIVLGSYNAG